MLLRSIRRMWGLFFEVKWRWKLCFLQVIWFFLAAAALSTGHGKVTCDISQLCSNKSPYYWMEMRIGKINTPIHESKVQTLVSEAFHCSSNATHGATCFSKLCKALGELQVVNVSCRASQRNQSVCDVLLLLSHVVSTCDLQCIGETATQNVGPSLQPITVGDVERVADRNLCENVSPSSGGFVRCMSTSSLEEICKSNKTTNVTCSVFDENSEAAPRDVKNSCNRTGPVYCNCAAFCETETQLYATKINITIANVTTDYLKQLLLKPYASSFCNGDSQQNDFKDILTKYKRVHLECHGVEDPLRLYSCMVVLEMSGPVNYCSLRKLVQLIFEKEKSITSDRSLSRLMLCGGAPDLSDPVLLASNLNWTEVDLSSSEFCQPESRLTCEANQIFAVLLVDSCPTEPPITSTTQPTSQTNSFTTLSYMIHETEIGNTSFVTATPSATATTIHDTTMKSTVTSKVSSTTKKTTSSTDKTTPNTVTSPANLKTTVRTSTSAEKREEQANELFNQTQDVAKLNSSMVSNLMGDLENILEGPSVSQSVGKKIIDALNNLLKCDPEVLSGSTNRMIQMVDNLALKLDFQGDSGILSSTSLVLAVKTVDATNFTTTSFEIFNTDNVQVRDTSRSGVKKSAFALASLDLPSSLMEGLSPEEKQQASRVQFIFYINNSLFKDSSLDNQTAVSAVLGSSVANLSISNLKENVTFTIRHMNLTLENKTSCVFWNFTKNNGSAGWDNAGCSVVTATPEHTTCSCNHLTSFAILLDLSREGVSDPLQSKILTFITYIGCGVSSVFLAVTLITYMLFEKLLRDIPAKILVQLCFSLLLLNLLFLLNGWLSDYNNNNLCISTAFFLHYFLLSSFTWAGLEALHMYLSIVRVFTPYLSRYMLKFSLMGWGIPLIVVVVTVAVDKDNYGLVKFGNYTGGTADNFCWLRNDIAFYVGVVAYFVLIFVLCLLVFVVVMVQLSRIKKQNPHNQSPNRSAMTDVRSIVGLVMLLGLTWGLALFSWGKIRLPSLYLFTIFNSLLGLFVFIFHCAAKENVRRMWRTYLCCGNMRLAENSDWSRTATNNKSSNFLAAPKTTSVLQHSNRSSTVASEHTNSSGSVFVDSGISDRSNSDVVLNEIHRRSQSQQSEP